jgi:hypothetical protein
MVDISKQFNKLLEKFLPKFSKAINIDFGVGSSIGITNAKASGKKTNMNPLGLNKKEQKANIDMIKELVKGVNDDVAKKINYLTNKSISEKWSNKQLSEQLKGLFDKDSPNYIDIKGRTENIAQTESARLMNIGTDKTARRLGAKKKYLFNVMDSKTGDDSRVSQRKYGKPEQAIPLDEPFTYSYAGKQRVFMLPPDRPRDRSQPLYLFE